MDFGIAGVAVITVIAYLVGLAVKATAHPNRTIPVICAAVGGALGVAGLYTCPTFPPQICSPPSPWVSSAAWQPRVSTRR